MRASKVNQHLGVHRICCTSTLLRIPAAFKVNSPECSAFDFAGEDWGEEAYDYFVKLPRIRFLSADDPGAGQTIMAGLMLKKLRIRGLIQAHAHRHLS